MVKLLPCQLNSGLSFSGWNVGHQLSGHILSIKPSNKSERICLPISIIFKQLSLPLLSICAVSEELSSLQGSDVLSWCFVPELICCGLQSGHVLSHQILLRNSVATSSFKTEPLLYTWDDIWESNFSSTSLSPLSLRSLLFSEVLELLLRHNILVWLIVCQHVAELLFGDAILLALLLPKILKLSEPGLVCKHLLTVLYLCLSWDFCSFGGWAWLLLVGTWWAGLWRLLRFLPYKLGCFLSYLYGFCISLSFLGLQLSIFSQQFIPFPHGILLKSAEPLPFLRYQFFWDWLLSTSLLASCAKKLAKTRLHPPWAGWWRLRAASRALLRCRFSSSTSSSELLLHLSWIQCWGKSPRNVFIKT